MSNYTALCPNQDCGSKAGWTNNSEVRKMMAESGLSLCNSHMVHDTFECSECGANGCNHPNCSQHWQKNKK